MVADFRPLRSQSRISTTPNNPDPGHVLRAEELGHARQSDRRARRTRAGSKGLFLARRRGGIGCGEISLCRTDSAQMAIENPVVIAKSISQLFKHILAAQGYYFFDDSSFCPDDAYEKLEY